MAGIALGSSLGGAMVAIALAFGISAVVAPMTFARVPPQILAVQMLTVVLLAAWCPMIRSTTLSNAGSGQHASRHTVDRPATAWLAKACGALARSSGTKSARFSRVSVLMA